MKTPANILGHPIHPMIIPFPFALWTFSLIADLIYYFGSHDYLWVNVAFYTLLGGIIGAVLAAVPGIVDYFSIRDRKVLSIAAWHARFNIIALLVFGPGRLADLGKGLGEGIRNFRSGMKEAETPQEKK